MALPSPARLFCVPEMSVRLYEASPLKGEKDAIPVYRKALHKQANTGTGPKTKSAKGRNRTDDTSIFSAVLYQLSYLGLSC